MCAAERVWFVRDRGLGLGSADTCHERWDERRQHAALGRASPTRSTCSSAPEARSRSPVAPARSSPCPPSSSAHCAEPWMAGCNCTATQGSNPRLADLRQVCYSTRLSLTRSCTGQPYPGQPYPGQTAGRARLGDDPARGHMVARPVGAPGGRGRAPGPRLHLRARGAARLGDAR